MINLWRNIENQVNTVREITSHSNDAPEIRVHEIRKSLKKISSLFVLIGYRSESKTAFTAAKLLSSPRDYYCMREQLGAMLLTNPGEFKKPLEEFINAVDETLRMEYLEIPYPEIIKVTTYLVSLINEGLEKGDVPESRAKMIKSMSSLYGNARGLLENRKNLSPKDWHKLRKYLKMMYYQYGFLVKEGCAELVPGMDLLDKCTEALGDHHDIYILMEEMLRPQYGLAPDFVRFLHGHYTKRMSLILEEAKPLLESLLKLPEASYQSMLADVIPD